MCWGSRSSWDGNGPYAEFVNDGVRFSMYERAQLPGLLGQAPTYPAGLNGTFELAIDLPTAADADRMYQQVVTAGGRPVYAPRDEPWGLHSSMIADPDGNLIEIGSWNRGAQGRWGFRRAGLRGIPAFDRLGPDLALFPGIPTGDARENWPLGHVRGQVAGGVEHRAQADHAAGIIGSGPARAALLAPSAMW